ncbi:MAG: bifunctional nuclease family protein [Coriobacteriia bacterium]|nr:bifunctional nuclease family protein [Coriobacteriia bacterium]
MIQVRIAGLSLDPVSEQPVLLLVRTDDPTVSPHIALPIWIGHTEAGAILLALQGIEAPRPMTHDLLHNTIKVLGYTVARVEITSLDAGTFYASVILRGADREHAIDARPSDSVALAVRAGCPVFVAEDVFAEAAVQVTEVDEEEEVEKFRDFLEHVDPSDFMS